MFIAGVIAVHVAAPAVAFTLGAEGFFPPPGQFVQQKRGFITIEQTHAVMTVFSQQAIRGQGGHSGSAPGSRAGARAWHDATMGALFPGSRRYGRCRAPALLVMMLSLLVGKMLFGSAIPGKGVRSGGPE